MAKAEATVEELIGMIERALRLPEMQRRYVWRSTRTRLPQLAVFASAQRWQREALQR